MNIYFSGRWNGYYCLAREGLLLLLLARIGCNVWVFSYFLAKCVMSLARLWEIKGKDEEVRGW